MLVLLVLFSTAPMSHLVGSFWFNLASVRFNKSPTADEVGLLLDRAQGTDGVNSQIYHLLGRWHLSRGEVKAAQSALAQAAALDLANPFIYLDWGQAYMDAGQTDQAIAVWRQIREEQHIATYFFLQGEAAEKQGHTQLAINYYTTAIGIAPDLPAPYYALGDLYWAQGEKPEAVASYKQALTLKHDKAYRYYYYLARVSGYESDWTTALDAYWTLGELLPREWYPYAHAGGILYTKLGDTTGAIANYKRAIARCPTCYDLYLFIAEMYATAGEPDEARNWFQQAIQATPDEPEHLVRFTRNLIELRGLVEAEDMLRRAITIDPEDSKAQNLLETLLTQTDD